MLSLAGIFILSSLGLIKSDILSSFLIQIVVMFAIPLLMYTLLISKNVKQTFSDIGFRKISGKMVIISILLGVILYFLNSFVASASQGFIQLLGFENPFSSTSSALSNEFILKEFILTAVLPGFCEEILHRGIVLFGGKKSNNTRFLLIISSLLFGLTHLNINQFFYAAILGFLMGHVALVSNSIFPAMIIHFMNNFLSIYFAYGTQMKWDLATIFNVIGELIMSNLVSVIFCSTVGIFMLIFLFLKLTKKLYKERIKSEVAKIISSLELENLPLEVAEERVNQANKLINQHKTLNISTGPKTKFSFLEKSFFYSSIVLGCLITVSSFIWGIL